MAGASNSGARTAKSDGVSMSITGDKTRDKCIEILYDALALESGFRACCRLYCRFPFLKLRRLTFDPLPSVRSHIAACAHGRGYGVQGLQGDNAGVQVQDTDVVRQPQRQEQSRPAPKRDGRRHPRPDVCKNDQPGLSLLALQRTLKKKKKNLLLRTFGRDVYHRKWPLRNAKRLMRRSRKTICSYRSARPTNRQKQMPSSVAGASR